MSLTVIGVMGMVVMLMLMLAQIPVAFAMGIVGFLGFVYASSVEGALSLLAIDYCRTFNSYTLSVVPMFILMGELVFHSGISDRLYHAAYKWLGHIRGGLAMTTVMACAGFATVCGSNVATCGTMATLAVPEMKKFNYAPALATGSVCAGSTLGPLIPPSVHLIIYGILTQTSIGKLFIGAIPAGLIMVALFMLTIYVMCRRNPHWGPPGPRASFREKVSSLSGLWGVLALFMLVIGGLAKGWFTPTEAGAVGAGGALLLGLVVRNLTLQRVGDAAMVTIRIVGMAFMLLGGAVIFGHFLAVSRIPFNLATSISLLQVPPVVVLMAILLVYMIAGCFIEGMAFFILTIPIFFPVVVALGYDPVWFGVIQGVVGLMGTITPPVGINVYIVNSVIKDVPMDVVFRGATPFLPAYLICSAILILFPQIATFLPNL